MDFPIINPVDMTLLSGAGLSYIVNVADDMASEWAFQDAAGDAATSIYFHGQIHYQDLTGRLYQTSFLQHYNASIKRFEVVEDPEYEYQN
jgi:hypothetical protein